MNDQENPIRPLGGAEAIAKVKKLAEDARTAMFTTNLSQAPLTTRPMATQQVDEEGNIWFFSAKDSNKNQEIAQDPRVQLFYTNNGSSEYLSVYGKATILVDPAKIDELWNPYVKAWFTEGKDDPNLTLIKVAAEDGYYWDIKNNTVVQYVKIAYGALTGQTFDDSREGDLSL